MVEDAVEEVSYFFLLRLFVHSEGSSQPDEPWHVGRRPRLDGTFGDDEMSSPILKLLENTLSSLFLSEFASITNTRAIPRSHRLPLVPDGPTGKRRRPGARAGVDGGDAGTRRVKVTFVVRREHVVLVVVVIIVIVVGVGESFLRVTELEVGAGRDDRVADGDARGGNAEGGNGGVRL